MIVRGTRNEITSFVYAATPYKRKAYEEHAKIADLLVLTVLLVAIQFISDCTLFFLRCLHSQRKGATQPRPVDFASPTHEAQPLDTSDTFLVIRKFAKLQRDSWRLGMGHRFVNFWAPRLSIGAVGSHSSFTSDEIGKYYFCATFLDPFGVI